MTGANPDPESSVFSKPYATGCRIKSGMTGANSALFLNYDTACFTGMTVYFAENFTTPLNLVMVQMMC
jgi:hypothetical protein